MISRPVKQLIYGGFYLLFFFLISLGTYLLFFRPTPTCSDKIQNQSESGIDCGGPCIPCEIKNLKLFEISWKKTFTADDKLTFVSEIKNPNPNHGASYFDYLIEFYNDEGNKIQDVKDNSFIYGGEIKDLVQIISLSPSLKNISKIEVYFSNIRWAPNDDFIRPQLQVREEKVNLEQPINISGTIANQSAFSLSKVEIIGFLFNKYDLIAAVSKTEINNIEAFQEQKFNIIFPKDIDPSDISEELTKISFTGK